jgi:hypothetical protein
MNKTLFINCLQDLKSQFEYLDRMQEAFKVILPQDYITGFDYGKLIDSHLALLAHVMGDVNDWIDYFVWELNFGEKWEEGMVTDNEKDVKLQTIDDLWNLLNYKVVTKDENQLDLFGGK